MDQSTMCELLQHIKIKDMDQLQIIDGNQLYSRNTIMHSPDEFALYIVDIEPEGLEKLVSNFSNTFSDEYVISVFTREDVIWNENAIQIANLAKFLKDKENASLFFRPKGNNKSIIKFQEMIAHLRAPEGCPWDRKQTHQTLRTNLLEETYEVLEAIDEDNIEKLREELGDLLLQIVLHAQIASENKSFNFSEVVYDIHQKIRNRHPHVFEDIDIDGVKGVMKNWEKIKDDERNAKNGDEFISILSSIPKQLPSLSIAQKYQERAARVGFDWEEIHPVYLKIDEELKEVKDATSKEGMEEELGDLLFAVVNLVRWHGFDAESALRITNDKFRSRFEYIEESISEGGRSLTDASLSEMDFLWDKAKRNEMRKGDQKKE